ncbi:MAG: ABC transporter permease [Xenophilus sp.]
MTSLDTTAALPIAARRPAGGLLLALGDVFKRSIALILFFAAWELIPRTGLLDTTFLPPFSDVLARLAEMLASGELPSNIAASLGRSLAGLAIAVAFSVPLGLAIGWYTRLGELLNPLLEIFRNTAPLALLPVFILILGLGEISKITMVTYACVWPVLLNTISAVRQVDPLLVRSARSMGLNSSRLFLKVVLPASVPTIFTGIRLAGASSLLVLIAAEMAGAQLGLGYLVSAAQFNFQIATMYAGIITLSLIGLLFNGFLRWLEHRLTRWSPSHAGR